jgi:hypothetical protein
MLNGNRGETSDFLIGILLRSRLAIRGKGEEQTGGENGGDRARMILSEPEVEVKGIFHASSGPRPV